MKLNHLNLPVPDVNATRDFLVKYFEMKVIFELPNDSLVILQDEAGLVLNLSHFGKDDPKEYDKTFHIGFFLDSREEVESIHAKLVADGLKAGTPKAMHGRFSFYVHSPGGFLTEVGALESVALKGTSSI